MAWELWVLWIVFGVDLLGKMVILGTGEVPERTVGSVAFSAVEMMFLIVCLYRIT